MVSNKASNYLSTLINDRKHAIEEKTVKIYEFIWMSTIEKQVVYN